MEEKINPELAVTIAIRQNRLRQQIQLAEMQKSEEVKVWNDKIKELKVQLAMADEEWRTGAVQMDFDFAESNDE